MKTMKNKKTPAQIEVLDEDVHSPLAQEKFNIINIYVVFTPFQAISASEIQKQNSLEGDNVTFCFLKKDEWNEDLLGENTIYLHGNNIIQSVSNMNKFKNKVEEIMSRYVEVNAIISHALHPAANYLMFSKAIAHRHIMPEGMLNYCQRFIDLKLTIHMLMRKFACASIGFPYKTYRGHVSGHETGLYDSAFYFRKECFVTTGKVNHEIQLTKVEERSCNKKTLMILDQDIESLLPGNLSLKMRKTLDDYIDQQNFDAIYYKPHYTKNAGNRCIKNKDKLIILDKNIPAEIYITKIYPTHIISFFSSALLHAKLINPSIHSIAIYPELAAVALRNKVQGVDEVMRDFGVEIFK